jgi:hypothetical protein
VCLLWLLLSVFDFFKRKRVAHESGAVAATPLAAHQKSIFLYLDFFFKDLRIKHDSDKLDNKKTTLGGLCSVLLIISFLAASIYIILLFNLSNVLSVTALDIMTGSLLISGAENLFLNEKTPWSVIDAKPSSISARISADMLPLPPLKRDVNLQFRLFGQSALGCNKIEDNVSCTNTTAASCVLRR